ncbi:MAG: ATP-binding protein [Cycloclasticus sp.]|nr:MAG: ATP-binding protein [Cycloclasticus sp.]
MNSSIQSRLIGSAMLVLFCFLGLAGLVFDAAYKRGAESALDEQLQIHLYSILAEVELSNNNQINIPSNLSEPRFSRINSGLSAYIYNTEGIVSWRSSSSVGINVASVASLNAGQKTFITKQLGEQSYKELHYKAILENSSGKSSAFEFIIIGSTATLDMQIANFRSVLWQWLVGIGVLLITVQFLIIRRSLKPLRQIVVDLEGIHQGKIQHLHSHDSRELKDLASTLNKLIDNERKHLKRYRNTLADLAHSLKTPLSVLTGLYNQPDLSADDIETLEVQTLQMRQLVDYQLQKAAAKGHQTISAPLNLRPIIQQLTNSLDKVYADKNLNLMQQVDDDTVFNAEKGDMFELFGNLLDNAYKWADSTVRVSLHSIKGSKDASSGIQFIIEDDGPGIAEDELDNVLQRGIRVDETVKGHGIGLAVVKELVTIYNGTLESVASQAGGQKWVVFLPEY